MKKLLAILFIASAGAVLFAQEATPPESGETQGTSTRPFFIDRNNDGICDNCGYFKMHREKITEEDIS